MPLFGGSGVTPSLRGNVTNVISLQPGSVYPLSVPGWYQTKPGLYSCLQEWDPITAMWRTVGGGGPESNLVRIYSDGTNYRLANFTGCAVGANVTNGGTGWTSAPVVTASAGASSWRAIIGGAVSTTVVIVNGGANYGYPPIPLFSAPPPGGIQATGFCTLTTGAVSSVTMIDQGAGYLTPPTVTFLNDPREGSNGITQGSGASASCTLTGAGTITGLLCLDPGTTLTAVPTFTFTGGGGSGAAATALMCWCVTAYTVTGGGTVYSGDVIISAYNKVLSAYPSTAPIPASAYLNPTTQQALVRERQCRIIGALSGGVITATGQKLIDGGIYAVAAASLSPVIFSNTPPATVATLGLTMGGLADTSILLTT